MTTSGSYAFDPTFAELFDEACERAGIDPSRISERHIQSAKMSLSLLLTEWVVRDGDAIYRITEDTESVVAGVTNFTPVSGTMDILDMVMEYNASEVDMPMIRLSREDYLNLADKDADGQPANYYVDYANLNAPRVFIWPVPDAPCVFKFDTMRYVQTPGQLSETLDIHRPWLDALAAGLALRLAGKYSLDRVGLLKADYAEAYAFARRAGSGNSQIVIAGRGFGARGRTIRR